MNLLRELQRRFAAALAPLTDDAAAALEMIRPAQDARFGDYQANCAMPLGKQLGKPPREIAQQIVNKLQVDDICHPPEIAGPGFINLKFRDEWLSQQLNTVAQDERLGVEPVAKPRTYVVDYSSPNVAKPMHVGHIRSTVIGDALSRTLRFLGHQVITDNHLGDWGTQFGMIIYGYRNFLDAETYKSQPVAELGRVYRVVRMIMDYHESVAKVAAGDQQLARLESDVAAADSAAQAAPQDKKLAKAAKRAAAQLTQTRNDLAETRAKIAGVDASPEQSQLVQQHADIQQAVLQETAKLHAGDESNLQLWREFLPKCRVDIQRIYDRLNITFDHELGESFYHDRLAAVVEDFERRQLSKPSEGATCVFLEGFDAPMIIRKQDGAFLYSTTDLATIQYRVENWAPDVVLYVVDFRQGDHFQKLFAAAKLWGYDQLDLRHIEFGTVLGEDGRPFRTRAGDTVGLEGLLDAAVARAKQIVSDNDDGAPGGPRLSEEQRNHIANVVGHAAIKYADLSQNRTSDYTYSEEKMVALKGNTATYLQYSYARAINILGKAGADVAQLRADDTPLEFTQDKERQLALTLLRFPEACDDVVVDYRPNLLTNYLYELATLLSEFYESCPVLRADTDAQRRDRLKLCDLTSRVLKLGLSLLGIDVVDQM
ncbi:MAG: arginine--tRNA ligase [Planctomycetales bacterium]|nr:arginine--tRNA ligase [Planctomycetales bacterium]